MITGFAQCLCWKLVLQEPEVQKHHLCPSRGAGAFSRTLGGFGDRMGWRKLLQLLWSRQPHVFTESVVQWLCMSHT